MDSSGYISADNSGKGNMYPTMVRAQCPASMPCSPDPDKAAEAEQPLPRLAAVLAVTCGVRACVYAPVLVWAGLLACRRAATLPDK